MRIINDADYQRKVQYIEYVIKKYKSVQNRITRLLDSGFTIKKVYVAQTKLNSIIRMKRKNEIRIVIGRPKEHLCKEVYAVILTSA